MVFVPDELGSHADLVTYRQGLQLTHARDVKVRLLLLDHTQVTRNFHSDEIIDGSIIIDTSRDAIGACSLVLLDPTMSIGWEPDSPRDFPHLRRMLQVIDSRWVDGLGWVDCPVLTGPVTDFDRDGAQVTISADSKDRLALADFGRNRTWHKKRKVVDVITEMMVTYSGESATRIHLPAIKDTLPRALTVKADDLIWVQVRKLAESVGMKVFYDGRGHMIMRRAATAANFTVDYRSLASAVRIDRNAPDVKNRWIVRGPKPRGNKKRVVADIRLPAAHPWSAQNLGRNGVPRWLLDLQEPGQVKTHEKAVEIATKQRNEQLKNSQQVSCDMIPRPDVEPFDLGRVVDPYIGTFMVRANQYTLPLVSGPATLGTITRASLQPHRRSKKKNHQGHHHNHKWSAA